MDGMFDHVKIFVGKVFNISFFINTVRGAGNQNTTQALLMHLFKFPGNFFPGHGAARPPPVGVGPAIHGWVAKIDC